MKAADSFKTQILTSELSVNGPRRRFVDTFLELKTVIEGCRFVGVGFSNTVDDEEGTLLPNCVHSFSYSISLFVT